LFFLRLGSLPRNQRQAGKKEKIENVAPSKSISSSVLFQKIEFFTASEVDNWIFNKYESERNAQKNP